MTPLSLSRIADWTGGRLHGEDALVDVLVTDTRRLDIEDDRSRLFVALKGERFDGHAHVAEAARLGVRAALVSSLQEVAVPQVLVTDTERALAALAAALQRARSQTVLALTGSNGKTTVKTLLGAILSGVAPTHANPGNRNNEIGLPLAVIEAPDDARFAIYEMGAGKPGDIAYLTTIVRPDVALVNNIAPAHLERMGSLLGIAETKGAIYQALAPAGTAVVNADDAFGAYYAARAAAMQPPRTVLRFGLEASADVRAEHVVLAAESARFTLATPHGEAPVELPLPGRHNVANALAAAAMALAAGASLDAVVAGLARAPKVGGRLVAHRLANGAVLVDDSYNANPGSLAAAIATLAASGAAQTWLVLGDMRELGPDAPALHAEAGRRAREAGITRLFALGPLSAEAAAAFGDGGMTFASHAALAEALGRALQPGVRCLVKGSRGSAMDVVVGAVLQATGEVDDAA
jgi:UDP-N-acetylmuramoyl-tripeptide--D-alanyl-D-alanine ligase